MPTIRINISFMMFILSVISILLGVIKRTLRGKGGILGSERSKGGRGGGSDIVSRMDFKERIARYVKKQKLKISRHLAFL